DFGVRLFNAPEESKNKKSLAEKRRGFRGKRRLLNRRHCRSEDLKQFFEKVFGDNFLQKFESFAKKSTNLLKYDETKFFNPYITRHQALSGKVELVELLYILLHISKYRGYKEFYLDNSLEEKNEENKKIYAAVGEVKKIFQENNYGSIAEMVIKNEKFRHSQNKKLLSAHNHNPNKVYENKEEVKKNHKHFVFPRELLVEEMQKILEKQSEYYPELKKKFSYTLLENGKSETKDFSAQEIIKLIIFRQRDFEDEEKELGGIEKEKEKGEKRETLRKQLETFLNKLVGKGNYSFPKGIEFETDFLDYLKENSSFYPALIKNCSSQFYLNYEDYKKTIFYQIGRIIFEKITPQRRKNELDSLSQKVYSLEAFGDCLAKLEKVLKSGKKERIEKLKMQMIEFTNSDNIFYESKKAEVQSLLSRLNNYKREKELKEVIIKNTDSETSKVSNWLSGLVVGIDAQNFSEEQLTVTYLQNYFASQEEQYKEKLLAEMQEIIENFPLVIQLREENNTLKSFIEGYKLGKEFVKPTQKGQEFEDYVHEKLQEIFSGSDIIENITHMRTSAGTRADVLQTVRSGNEFEKVIGKIVYETKKLIEEIQEADGIIRQRVLSHIFNNYDEIIQVTGGNSFLNIIVGSDNATNNKLTLSVLKEKVEELEKELQAKGSNNQSLEKTKSELDEKEKELLNLNKHPENDAHFCTWLRDAKQLTSKEIFNYDIEQLKKEYVEDIPSQQTEKDYELRREQFKTYLGSIPSNPPPLDMTSQYGGAYEFNIDTEELNLESDENEQTAQVQISPKDE
ncbi:17075_t:CDS:2, partial [Funneliformis geosporum]